MESQGYGSVTGGWQSCSSAGASPDTSSTPAREFQDIRIRSVSVPGPEQPESRQFTGSAALTAGDMENATYPRKAGNNNTAVPEIQRRVPGKITDADAATDSCPRWRRPGREIERRDDVGTTAAEGGLQAR